MHIKQSFLDAQQVLSDWIAQEPFEEVARLAEEIAQAFSRGNKVLICGNGGSCCDAMHFAEECTGRFRDNRRALPVLALSDPSHITCVGNDYGFDAIFQRGVEAFAQKGDVFIALSTSGNSQNIINAVAAAEEKGCLVSLFLGKGGGKLKGRSDIEFLVPGDTSDRIQEIHMLILHITVQHLEHTMGLTS